MPVELLDISISRPKATPERPKTLVARKLDNDRVEFEFPNGLKVRRQIHRCLGCGQEWTEHGLTTESQKRWIFGKCHACLKIEKINRDAAIARERQLRLESPGKNAKERRYIAQMLATPLWRDRVKINEMYERARQMTHETGIAHHVDHIYPIQSIHGCGLHVHQNLQIMPGSENSSKSNKFPLFDSPALR